MITKDDIGKIFYFKDYPLQEKRIIEVNESEVFIIEMNGSSSTLPKQLDLVFLEEELRKGGLVWVEEKADKPIEKQSKLQQELNQKRWESIGLKWKDEQQRPLFFDRSQRRELMKKISKELEISESQTRRLLTQFWRGGMTKRSLAAEKRGIKKGSDIPTGRIARNGKGLLITEEVKTLFAEAYHRYHLKAGMSIEKTFSNLLKDHYCIRKEEKGIVSYEYIDEQKTPTYSQFYYWIQNYRDEEEELRSKYGDKEFENSFAVLVSSTTVSTKGAGAKAELDATHLPIELVSERDRSKCVGTPLLEMLVDVYSKMIMGYVLTLSNESYHTGALTLLNSMENKKDFAQRNGVTIKDEDWPVHHLPQIISSDNGPFCAYYTAPLEEAYGCYIQNTTARKGSAKGNVERKNKTFEDYIRDSLPGSSKVIEKGRGAKDPADEACLSLKELNQLIIKKIVEFNHTVITDYPLTPEQISQGLVATPINLWNYSIKEATDHLLFTDNLERAKIVLLPRIETGRKVRKDGVRLFNFFYTSKDTSVQNWMINHRGETVEVAYDPEDITQIYIIDKERIISLTLNEKHQAFSGMSLNEVKQYQKLKRQQDNKQRQNAQLKKLETIDLEEELTRAAKSESLKSKNKKDKKGNRKEEIKFIKQKERTSEAEKVTDINEDVQESEKKDQLRSALFQERVNEIIKNKQES